MCGIASILTSRMQRVPDVATIDRMNSSLAHRGPDGSGIKIFEGNSAYVGLGHRRLSIIDLASGSQPMSNEDGSVWISYNGEIYNHGELRQELIGRGHKFRTKCDTETIVHAFEEWGPKCLDRFRGMFAFVIWDDKNKSLFAARDRLGIKPFYYSFSNGELVCASEIKALIASGWCEAQLNHSTVPEYLTLGYLCGDETLFQGIHKLLPGHWLSWKNGELRTEQYWEIPLANDSQGIASEGELVDQFLNLFRESVRLRLMSDVPLGVFLSGGLDSSAIAAVMAEQMSDPVKTFSVGFESDYYSEFDFAREVASTIGADHHEVVLKPEEMFASLPRLIWHEDEPIRNASSVALFEVANLASSEVKVVLTGEGSDELFAGYERYWATLFNMKWGGLYEQLMPRWLRENYVRPSLSRWPLPGAVKRKLRHTFLNFSQRPEEVFFENWHSILPPPTHQNLLTSDCWQSVRHIDPYSATMRLYNSRPANNPLDRMLFADQKSYLVELLRKQDTMSMAASIESRVPFLDHKMVEFAVQVPGHCKLRGLAGKYLVKRAMNQLLPESIIKRKKMGFPVPISQWFRRRSMDTVRSILTSDTTKNRGMFNTTYLGRLADEHSAGFGDNSDALWTALNFELWARVFLDGESCSAVAEEVSKASCKSHRSELVGVA